MKDQSRVEHAGEVGFLKELLKWCRKPHISGGRTSHVVTNCAGCSFARLSALGVLLLTAIG